MRVRSYGFRHCPWLEAEVQEVFYSLVRDRLAQPLVGATVTLPYPTEFA